CDLQDRFGGEGRERSLGCVHSMPIHEVVEGDTEILIDHLRYVVWILSDLLTQATQREAVVQLQASASQRILQLPLNPGTRRAVQGRLRILHFCARCLRIGVEQVLSQPTILDTEGRGLTHQCEQRSDSDEHFQKGKDDAEAGVLAQEY